MCLLLILISFPIKELIVLQSNVTLLYCSSNDNVVQNLLLGGAFKEVNITYLERQGVKCI